MNLAEFVGVKHFSGKNLRLMRFVYEEVAGNTIWQWSLQNYFFKYLLIIFRVKNS